MMLSFIPKLIYESVTDLTPEVLHQHGIDVLFLDFDNTIVPYTRDDPSPEVEAWFGIMKQAGIRLCVVSNTKRQRAPDFCARHGIGCVTHAAKPFPGGIRRAAAMYPDAGGIALVGDQIYTDVLGANSAGVISVLIRPIHLHNIWLKLRHCLELPWIYIGRRRLHA